MAFAERLKTSAGLFLRHLKLHPVMYIMDILFILLAVFSFAALQMKIIDRIQAMSDMVMEELSAASGEAIDMTEVDSSMFNDIMASSPEISRMFSEAILFFIALVVLLYLIWSFFQGINWSMSNRVYHRKHDWVAYMKRFFGINLLWFFIFMLVLYIWFSITFYNMKSFIPLINQTALNWIMALILMVLAYFAIISYVLAYHHSTWKSFGSAFSHGYRYLLDMLMMFGSIIGTLAISLYLAYIFYQVSALLSLAVLVVVFIPMLSLIRFFAVVSINDVMGK